MYLCTYAALIQVGNKTCFFLECEWRSWGSKEDTSSNRYFYWDTAFTYNQPFSVNHVEYLFSGSEVD